MTSLHAVNMYLAANLLLLLAAIGVACLRGVGGRSTISIAYRTQLQIAHVLTLAAVLLPSVSRIFAWLFGTKLNIIDSSIRG